MFKRLNNKSLLIEFKKKINFKVFELNSFDIWTKLDSDAMKRYSVKDDDESKHRDDDYDDDDFNNDQRSIEDSKTGSLQNKALDDSDY